jgi:ubiquinone/menaquinone biosynthesis C-methylase UbiE
MPEVWLWLRIRRALRIIGAGADAPALRKESQGLSNVEGENDRVRRAYEKRKAQGWDQRYCLFNKGYLLSVQERERVLLSMLARTLGTQLSDKHLLDIGCGTGGTLLPMLQYGFQPECCFGIDILADRIAAARKRLPNVTFQCCSAQHIPFTENSFDLATMFTCLSSILSDSIRAEVCRVSMRVLKPGGWVLIYDFRINNPFNPDVRAVSLKELKRYYSGCRYITKTLTLLPMLGRAVGKCSPALCGLLSLCPFLRMHRMTMFQKPKTKISDLRFAIERQKSKIGNPKSQISGLCT